MDEGRTYEVRLVPTAHRQLLRLPRRVRDRVADAIRLLSGNPRPTACKKLAGQPDYYRIRVGDYRVLYEVRDREILVIASRSGTATRFTAEPPRPVAETGLVSTR